MADAMIGLQLTSGPTVYIRVGAITCVASGGDGRAYVTTGDDDSEGGWLVAECAQTVAEKIHDLLQHPQAGISTVGHAS